MVDAFALALSHGMLALVIWRLLKVQKAADEAAKPPRRMPIRGGRPRA